VLGGNAPRSRHRRFGVPQDRGGSRGGVARQPFDGSIVEAENGDEAPDASGRIVNDLEALATVQKVKVEHALNVRNAVAARTRRLSDIALPRSTGVERDERRLERLGIISGYTVVLDHSRLGPSLEAFTELRIAGDAGPQRVMEAALWHEEVEECFATPGDTDVLLHVRVDEVAHLQLLVKELRRTGMVTGTRR
jgi:Lrp/AsnC family transcriptional regulator, leucine-responsive regulatory protein